MTSIYFLHYGGICSKVEKLRLSGEEYLHYFEADFEHEFGFGGGSGDSGDILLF